MKPVNNKSTDRLLLLKFILILDFLTRWDYDINYYTQIICTNLQQFY